jgi:aspartyl protease family protein
MVRLFNARWPGFARLEACLLFGAILTICGRSATLQSASLLLLDAVSQDLQVPRQPVFWTLLAMLLIGPYLCAMIVADRLLTVRKGFAILSILSVAIWAATAALLAASLDPASMVSPAHAAILAAGASLLIHGQALRIGLADRGFIGLRLAARSAFDAGRPGPTPWAGGQTNAWFAPNPRGRADLQPQRRRGATALATLAWGSAFAAAIVAYVAYYRETPAHSLPRHDDPAPLPNIVTGGSEVSMSRGSNGHFVFDAMVNGRPVPMLFDTGASQVTLRAEDAARLGIVVGTLKFSTKVSTANGVGLVAPITIDTLTIGSITQHNVPAFVASPGSVRENLLGQSFLKNLRRYSVENNHVVLKAY